MLRLYSLHLHFITLSLIFLSWDGGLELPEWNSEKLECVVCVVCVLLLWRALTWVIVVFERLMHALLGLYAHVFSAYIFVRHLNIAQMGVVYVTAVWLGICLWKEGLQMGHGMQYWGAEETFFWVSLQIFYFINRYSLLFALVGMWALLLHVPGELTPCVSSISLNVTSWVR